MSTRSVIIGFGVAWAGYALLFTGYCWIRGYDISVKEIVAPVNWYQGAWPPGKAADTDLIPKGSGGSGTPANKVQAV